MPQTLRTIILVLVLAGTASVRPVAPAAAPIAHLAGELLAGELLAGTSAQPGDPDAG